MQIKATITSATGSVVIYRTRRGGWKRLIETRLMYGTPHALELTTECDDTVRLHAARLAIHQGGEE